MKAFIVIYFASFIGLAFQAEWSYDYETQWPGVCNSGLQQSPINIMTRDALVDVHGAHIRGPLVFSGYERVNVTALNNGYTLRWNAAPDQTPVVSGGPLRGNYTFLQFHLHWLSEHAINGMKYPLEIHLVHVKTGIPLEEAFLRPDGLAVIGVLGQVYSGEDSEYALEQIMPVVPSLAIRDDKVQSAPKIIDISRLFSPDPQSFYTYSGSLTTPNCQEVVTWIVMDQPIHLSDDQYKKFSKVDIGGIVNYRTLQRANRVVYRSVSSRSNMLSPSYLGLLITAFSYLASNLSSVFGKGWCLAGNLKKKILGDKLSECKLALS